MKAIPRESHLRRVEGLLRHNPVVAILGARQTGKTTLAREVACRRPGKTTVFDLEDPRDLALLDEPTLALGRLEGLVVLDEIQRRPGLFEVLRVLADRAPVRARFLVLGSATPALLRQGAETLAGRIAFHELPGLDLDEVGAANLERLWIRGGFPRSFLARSAQQSADWRADFIRTFLERDLPMLGAALPPPTLSRFWSMLAHYHGQIWNASEFAGSFGVSHTTVRKYVDLLEGGFAVRHLQPWAENLGKRLVRSPKVYLADSGILHALLGIQTAAELMRHPRLGASWEGFLLSSTVRRLGVSWRDCYFWATHSGAELDLLVVRGNRRLGFEFKRTDAPKVTPSIRNAMTALGLQSVDIIHAGERTFPLSREVRAVAAADICSAVSPLRR